MNKARFYFLNSTIIGLTLISLTAGFTFYKALFGVMTAILCSVVFETIRVGCLWSYTFHWLPKSVVLPIYTLVAITCALAGVTNFHARIIESHQQATKPWLEAIEKNIALLKSATAENSQAELQALAGKLDVCQRNLAWNPASVYWQNRLAQLVVQKTRVTTRRDSLLENFPAEPDEKWLTARAAVLGVMLEPMRNALGTTSATLQAIEELWHMDEVTVKKFVSLVIVIAVESAIMLLASIVAHQKPQPVLSRPTNNSMLEKLCQEHQRSQVLRFLEKCASSLANSGRLPMSSELAKSQREMRKKIGRISNIDIIEEMINQLQANRFGELSKRRPSNGHTFAKT